MKTSVTMIRKIGGFEIQQRTKDGMFNATTLLKQWNLSFEQKKEIASFLKMKSTKEFITALMDEEQRNDILNLAISPYLTTRGKNGGTWMHPYLFMDFAMWLNPKFKVKVIKFVYDELVKYRHNAGDNYINLSASGIKLKGYNFSYVATAINWIVFGKKGKGLRQTATENQLIDINNLQLQLSFAIDMDYIKSFTELKDELKKIWRTRNPKTPF